MTLAPDWTTCEGGGVVYALHLPCMTAFLVPQEHDCRRDLAAATPVGAATSKEHYDLMEMFEREFRGRRLEKEPKRLWPMGVIYQDGELNELFLAYRRGYAFGKALATTDASTTQSEAPNAAR